MFTMNILHHLINLDESVWADLRGKPLTDRGLAARLRPYGIRSKDVRIGDAVNKGYRREDLHDAWKRYLPSPQEENATSATSATDL
jgi:hypothetical protein